MLRSNQHNTQCMIWGGGIVNFINNMNYMTIVFFSCLMKTKHHESLYVKDKSIHVQGVFEALAQVECYASNCSVVSKHLAKPATNIMFIKV